MQRSLTLENTLGTRLSYARWFIIGGLFGYSLLNALLKNEPVKFNTTPMYLIGVYAVYNLMLWLTGMYIGRYSRLALNATVILDIIFASSISLLIEQPIFFFAFMPAMLAVVLIGIWEGIISVVAVGGLNVFYLATKSFNFQGDVAAIFYGLILSLLLLLLSIMALTSSSTPLIRVSEEMLEEALARANEANLVELQNRAKAVYRVANTLSATLDYQEVLETVLREMESVFDVSAGAIMLFEGSLNNMRVVDALGLSQTEQKASLQISGGVLKQVLTEGTPSVVIDRAELDDLYQRFPSLKSCRTVLLMPLRAGFEVFGLLFIASRHDNAYSTSDVELMVTLTAHTVIAMQNATLYRNLLEDRNKLLTQEEEVRHELARNLHDGPAQSVAAFSMQAELIRRLFKVEPERALEELANLGKQAQQTSREIRTLLYELRPLVLETQGLVPALEQYAARFPHSPSDPRVHFSTKNFELQLMPSVESTIFTVLQEAVNNARKHARARNIWLQLSVNESFIVATAQDDGVGFDVHAMQSNYDQRGSLGMINMHERANLVGGSVEVNSVVGQGTVIIMRVPINANTVELTVPAVQAS